MIDLHLWWLTISVQYLHADYPNNWFYWLAHAIVVKDVRCAYFVSWVVFNNYTKHDLLLSTAVYVVKSYGVTYSLSFVKFGLSSLVLFI